MSDTFVTFHGWVGNDVTHRTPNGLSVANFRVASTPRIKRGGEWTDGDTTWYSVSAWRSLADNVRDSVKKGDAVIIHGRLRTESWVREDKQMSTTLAVEATLVGHDLTRGTSEFTRSNRQERNENDAQMTEVIQEMIHRDSDDLTQMDPWGNPKTPVTEQDPFRTGAPAA
jgi:single-strand DNA-binding protein